MPTTDKRKNNDQLFMIQPDAVVIFPNCHGVFLYRVRENIQPQSVDFKVKGNHQKETYTDGPANKIKQKEGFRKQTFEGT